MKQTSKSIFDTIKTIYPNLTDIEKTVADFFLNPPELKDLSAKNVSSHLFVSGASLTRFAQKCGFNGYREFIFRYQQEIQNPNIPVSLDANIRKILSPYQTLLDQTYSLIDTAQIQRVCALFAAKSRIYIYGIGSSGLAAQELQFRMMRLGLNIYSMTDGHMMEMNSVVLNDTCLVMGLSVSGQTTELLKSIKAAKAAGAATVLVTSAKDASLASFCDEIITIAATKDLSAGTNISPQFPLLLLSDILYTYYLLSDTPQKERMHAYTLNILEKN